MQGAIQVLLYMLDENSKVVNEWILRNEKYYNDDILNSEVSVTLKQVFVKISLKWVLY